MIRSVSGLFATLVLPLLGCARTATPTPSTVALTQETHAQASWNALAVADTEVCVLAGQGGGGSWIWCWNGEHQRGFELDAVALVGVDGVRHASWWDVFGGDETEAMICALLGSGRVACWSPDSSPRVVPGVFGVTGLNAGREAICATTQRGHACFDSQLAPHWAYEPDLIEAWTRKDWEVDVADTDVAERTCDVRAHVRGSQLACAITIFNSAYCWHDDEAAAFTLVRDSQRGMQTVELEFDDDPFARWPVLRNHEFDETVAHLPKPEQHELARLLLPTQDDVCEAIEDSNGSMQWGHVDAAASIYDPCWRRELLDWALKQLTPSELSVRLDELLSVIPAYDYQSIDTLLMRSDGLPIEQQFELLLVASDAHVELADSYACGLDPSQYQDALAHQIFGVLECADVDVPTSVLADIARDRQVSAQDRVRALEHLREPFDERLFESLADDDRCEVAMFAADALWEASRVDRRPRFDRLADMSVDEIGEVICRLSWSEQPDQALAKLVARGRPRMLHVEYSEEANWDDDDDAWKASKPLSATDLPLEIQSFDCREEGDWASCEFDTTAPYQVDGESPDYSLTTAMRWSRFELHFERRRGRWEIEYALDVDGSDCTNC